MNWNMPIDLQEAVYDGLSGMVVLRLRGTPAAETLTALAKIWIGAICSRPVAWDAEQDLPRFKKAFVELAATMDRWPAPADFIARLPPREPQRMLNPPTSSGMSPATRALIDGCKQRLKRHQTPEQPSE